MRNSITDLKNLTTITILVICSLFWVTNAQVLRSGDAINSFFWTKTTENSVKSGCYGYVKTDSVLTASGKTTYKTNLWLPAYSWWRDLIPSFYLRTEIQTNKTMPQAVTDAVGHFSNVEWLTGFIRPGTTDSIRFYFPVLPAGTAYGRYDYYSVNVDATTNLEFYGAGDSIIAGTFVQKQPTSMGALNILARNAFIIELTNANPLRIKSIRCNGTHDSIISSYLGYDLSTFKKNAAWYGIDVLSVLQNIQVISLHSVRIEGNSPFLSSTTHRLTWKLGSPGAVDSCLIDISFDNKKTWNRAGKTGADTSYMLTIPPFESDSTCIKVTACGKLGERISTVSSLFTTRISSQFTLRMVPFDSGAVIAVWNPDALTLSNRKSVCIAYRTGSPVKTFETGGYKTSMYNLETVRDTITGLKSDSMYYFTVFVQDAAGKFHIANDQAIDSAIAIDRTAPNNNLILKPFFIDSSNVALLWYVNGLPDTDADTVGIWYNEFNHPQYNNRTASTFFKGWGRNKLGNDTIRDTVKRLDPGQLYYFSLFVADKEGNWSNAPENASFEARTLAGNSPAKGLEFTLGDSKNDTLLNGSLILLDTTPGDLYRDTIDEIKMPPAKGFISFAPAFSFRHGKNNSGRSFSFLTHIKIAGSVSNYGIGLYRYNITTAKWRKDTAEVTIDYQKGTIAFITTDLQYPFAIMLDTLAPKIDGLKKDTAAYTVTIPIVDRFTITDNIENPQITLLAGSGALGYSDIPKYFLSKDTTTGTYTTTIPAYIADQRSGLRGLIIASDGRMSDTVNISRKIIRSNLNCDDQMIPDSVWTPVMVTGYMTDSLLSSKLASSLKVDSFTYNNFTQRILKCKSSTEDSTQWLEYSDEIKDQFVLSPGKLYWIKTSTKTALTYGSAIIPALIDTFEIVLKKNGWTDFSLPYQFDIYSGDITDATTGRGATFDSVDLYRWVMNPAKRFQTECAYLKGLAVAEGPDTVFKGGSPLTALNHSSKDIVLRIPPVCLPLSTVGKKKEVLHKQNATQQWCIKLLFNDSTGSCFSSMYCAGTPADGRPKYFIPPPSFAPTSVTILDKSSGKEYGHAATGDLSDGGETFVITYRNYSSAPSVVTSAIAMVHNLPNGINALLYTDNNKGITQPSSITVSKIAPQQKTTGYLVVGSEEYIAGFIKKINAVFSFLPFTANSRLRIRYTLPIDVHKISISIFDLKGRRVGHFVKTAGLYSGEGFLTINNRFSSGYYIVQMKAEINNQKTPSILNRRWVFMR